MTRSNFEVNSDLKRSTQQDHMHLVRKKATASGTQKKVRVKRDGANNFFPLKWLFIDGKLKASFSKSRQESQVFGFSQYVVL